MKRLPANRFTIENHVGTMRYSIFSLWDFDQHKTKKHWKAIGWCDASKLQYRAKEDGYAVMLERVSVDEWGNKDDIGEIVWLHVRFKSQKDRIDYLNSL